MNRYCFKSIKYWKMKSNTDVSVFVIKIITSTRSIYCKTFQSTRTSFSHSKPCPTHCHLRFASILRTSKTSDLTIFQNQPKPKDSLPHIQVYQSKFRSVYFLFLQEFPILLLFQIHYGTESHIRWRSFQGRSLDSSLLQTQNPIVVEFYPF